MTGKDTYLLNGRKQNRLFVGERNGYQVYINGEKIAGVDDAYQQSPFIFATGEHEQPNLNPNALLNDFWYYSSDTASNANEPEHRVTWINEYVENSDEWYANESQQYEHLAHAGLILSLIERSQYVQQLLGLFHSGHPSSKVHQLQCQSRRGNKQFSGDCLRPADQPPLRHWRIRWQERA